MYIFFFSGNDKLVMKGSFGETEEDPCNTFLEVVSFKTYSICENSN